MPIWVVSGTFIPFGYASLDLRCLCSSCCCECSVLVYPFGQVPSGCDASWYLWAIQLLLVFQANNIWCTLPYAWVAGVFGGSLFRQCTVLWLLLRVRETTETESQTMVTSLWRKRHNIVAALVTGADLPIRFIQQLPFAALFPRSMACCWYLFTALGVSTMAFNLTVQQPVYPWWFWQGPAYLGRRSEPCWSGYGSYARA